LTARDEEYDEYDEARSIGFNVKKKRKKEKKIE